MKRTSGDFKIRAVLAAAILMLIAASGRLQAQPAHDVVAIGTQAWSAQNLNVDRFRNGDPIPQAKTEEEWMQARANRKPVWCFYNNDPANGPRFGRIYNWYAVNDPRGLAPPGWHVPTDEEWTILTEYLGGAKAAGEKMKSTSGWTGTGNGSNQSGFNGLPGGYRNADGSFDDAGNYGDWWCSTEASEDYAWIRGLNYYGGSVYRDDDNKGRGMSVRCVKD